MDPSLNTWTILFLLAAAQGLFLSVVILLRKDRIKQPKRLLSAIIFCFSLILIYCVAYWTRYLVYLPKATSALLTLTYVIGPLMLFYAHQFRDNKKPISRLFYHCIPFGFHATLIVAHWSSSNGILGANHFLALNVVQNIHLLVYAGLIILESTKGSTPKWVRYIAFAYTGYSLNFFMYYVMSWTGILKIEYDYMVSVMMSLFIYFVGYYSYNHQSQLFGSTKKYQNSGLSDSASLAIYKKVINHIRTLELYLNSSVKLQELANELGLSTHIVSQVINKHSGKNFSDLMNELRVKRAIELIHTPGYNNEKLIAIAYDSGFNNKASFNNAFKKVTGFAPSVYRKQHTSSTIMEIAS